MAETISFETGDGRAGEGWLARPATRGPAVVVIQEWWGLVPHIRDVAERFALEGFLAVAPDLYHGQTTTSPDAAGRLLMELDVERAGQEIEGAGRHLLSLPDCSSARYGVVGFCMGGALAQYAATRDPKVGAAVSFYGGFKKVPLEWESLDAPLLLIYGEEDQGVPASQGTALEETLKGLGKRVEAVVYPGAGHGFFNDSRPEVYRADAASDAWRRTLDLFRASLV